MAHGSNDWHSSKDYKNIKRAVSEKISSDIPVMPLKFSKVVILCALLDITLPQNL
jgi:hypothetical protein